MNIKTIKKFPEFTIKCSLENTQKRVNNVQERKENQDYETFILPNEF